MNLFYHKPLNAQTMFTYNLYLRVIASPKGEAIS